MYMRILMMLHQQPTATKHLTLQKEMMSGSSVRNWKLYFHLDYFYNLYFSSVFKHVLQLYTYIYCIYTYIAYISSILCVVYIFFDGLGIYYSEMKTILYLILMNGWMYKVMRYIWTVFQDRNTLCPFELHPYR